MNEDNLSRGFIVLYKSLPDNPIWTHYPATYLKIWIYCLFKAAFRPHTYRAGGTDVYLPVGTFISTAGEIAVKVGVTRSATRRALTALETDHMIVSKAATKYTLYTVVNFEAYQNGNLKTDHLAATQPATPRPRSGHIGVTKPTTKEQITNKKELLPVPAEPAVEAEPSLPKFDSDKFFMERWWPIVWSKANAKKAARKAWNKIVKDEARAIWLTERAKLLGPRYLATAEKSGSTPLYPSTWLNDDRWDDQPLLPGFDAPIPTSPEQQSEKKRKALESLNADREERGLPPVDDFE